MSTERRWTAFLWVLVFFLIQNAVMTLLPFRLPPLLLIVVLFYALYEGPLFGAVLGCAAGFLMDLYGVGRMGPQMMLYAACGVFAGYSASKFFRDSFVSQVVLPAFAVYFVTFCNLAAAQGATGESLDGLRLAIEAFVPKTVILTAAVSPLFFMLLKRISFVPSYRRRR